MSLPPKTKAEEFDSYLRRSGHDLIAAMNEPSRFQPLLEMVANLRVERILDVGCGIGQMLYPFVVFRGAFGVGLDPTPQACRMGADFYATHAPSARVRFVYSKGETLPFASGSFDVVNCGLALPYMNNARAIDEMGRVLRPGGILLLKIHHARYYLNDFYQSLLSRRLLSMAHAGRVLAAGAIYHLTGQQTDTRLFGNETFQTRWLLRRELARCGFKIERERPDSNPLTPAFVISKEITAECASRRTLDERERGFISPLLPRATSSSASLEP
jgi:ubiquinone/menaquinone biosynthesis C-methylase UbiE